LAGTLFPQARGATTAAAATTPEVGPGFVLTGSDTSDVNAGKYPSVATNGNTVHMAGNPDMRAKYWTKQDTATTANNPLDFGDRAGDTDYTEAAVATAPDGTVYEVWIVQRSGIAMRSKPAGGDWGANKTIFKTGSFMAYIDIAVSSTGEIFVVW